MDIGRQVSSKVKRSLVEGKVVAWWQKRVIIKSERILQKGNKKKREEKRIKCVGKEREMVFGRGGGMCFWRVSLGRGRERERRWKKEALFRKCRGKLLSLRG